MTDNTQNTHEPAAPAAAQQARPGYAMLRVYAKNCSLETPDSPAIFRTPWKPELKVSFSNHSTLVEKSREDAPQQIDTYEVVLRVTVTCKVGEQTAFICEVNQAGLFALTGIKNQEEVDVILGAIAPNTLFPYAREAVASFVNRGSFPALNLQPVDFIQLYRARRMQALKQAQAAAQAEKKDEPVA